jgi:hypothetical protein
VLDDEQDRRAAGGGVNLARWLFSSITMLADS